MAPAIQILFFGSDIKIMEVPSYDLNGTVSRVQHDSNNKKKSTTKNNMAVDDRKMSTLPKTAMTISLHLMSMVMDEWMQMNM